MIKRIYTKKIHPFSHLILWAILLFLIIGILTANLLKVDVVTKAVGQVVPSKQIQILSNLEGGIIRRIYVKADDIVKKDQILMQLDEIIFKSEYQKGKAKELALRAKIARLHALAFNQNFTPDQILLKEGPSELINTEKSYYEAKKNELINLQSRRDLLTKEINLTKPLVEEGVMSTVELLRLERELAQIRGSISTFQGDVLKDLTDSKDQLAQVVEANQAYLDRVRRTTVRAPLYGVIKDVLINTESGTIKPNEPLIQMVPLEDTLLIEAKVLPSDIGFVEVGQNTDVKITAFDYTIYGSFDGKVERISADTFKDEKENTFYRIWVRTDRNYLVLKHKKYLILPGMEATVDVLTGKRTVMHYLLKPFMRAKEAALIER